MPSYNRNLLYDSVVLAYIAEKLELGEKISFNSIVDDIGFSKTTIMHTVRRLTGQDRLSVERDGLGRGSTFNYQVKTPPTQLEKHALKMQRQLKQAVSNNQAL